MSDKDQLIKDYKIGTLGKQGLGRLRRLLLTEILRNPWQFYDEKFRKLDRARIAEAVGFGTTPATLRQSFKHEIEEAEASLVVQGVVVAQTRTNADIGQESAVSFLSWIEERLKEPDFEWPVSHKGHLYRRGLWASYLGQELEDIARAPSLFARNGEVKDILDQVDVKIVEGQVQTCSLASASALDELTDTMTSRALSTLRAEVKELQEKLVAERESRLKTEKRNALLEQEVNRLQAKEQSLLSTALEDIKIAGLH